MVASRRRGPDSIRGVPWKSRFCTFRHSSTELGLIRQSDLGPHYKRQGPTQPEGIDMSIGWSRRSRDSEVKTPSSQVVGHWLDSKATSYNTSGCVCLTGNEGNRLLSTLSVDTCVPSVLVQTQFFLCSDLLQRHKKLSYFGLLFSALSVDCYPHLSPFWHNAKHLTPKYIGKL